MTLQDSPDLDRPVCFEEDPDMPALLDEETSAALWDASHSAWLEDPDLPALLDEETPAASQGPQSVVYHSYPPDMHIRRAFDWDTFIPFYIELENAAQASPKDFIPFHEEIEKLVVELTPDDQARDKLLKELIPQNSKKVVV
jgi:hypothetical protein